MPAITADTPSSRTSRVRPDSFRGCPGDGRLPARSKAKDSRSGDRSGIDLYRRPVPLLDHLGAVEYPGEAKGAPIVRIAASRRSRTSSTAPSSTTDGRGHDHRRGPPSG
jgi:hypothetical protein